MRSELTLFVYLSVFSASVSYIAYLVIDMIGGI